MYDISGIRIMMYLLPSRGCTGRTVLGFQDSLRCYRFQLGKSTGFPVNTYIEKERDSDSKDGVDDLNISSFSLPTAPLAHDMLTLASQAFYYGPAKKSMMILTWRYSSILTIVIRINFTPEQAWNSSWNSTWLGDVNSVISTHGKYVLRVPS